MLDSAQLRPTGDRIRETLFNWLMEGIKGARCLDLFAGTGILGLEALSRGAQFVTFVEQEVALSQQLKAILKGLNAEKNSEVMTGDAYQFLKTQRDSQPYQVVFLDPPFENFIYPLIEGLAQSALLAQEAWIYIEQRIPLEPDKLPSGWDLVKQKATGQVHYHLVKCGG